MGENEDEALEQENMSTYNRNMYRCTWAMHMLCHEMKQLNATHFQRNSLHVNEKQSSKQNNLSTFYENTL